MRNNNEDSSLKIKNTTKFITMKKIIKSLAFALLIGVTVAGCKKAENSDDSASTTGDFDKSSSAYLDSRTVPTTVATVPSVISGAVTLNASTEWIIDGPTYVVAGGTLTIQPGTFIKGKKNSTSGNPSFLLVAKGGKLIANGTTALPIVFTSDQAPCSRNAGDWGGVVLLGNGITNVATTTVIEGILPSYVTSRGLPYPSTIEYGGSSEADAANASSLKNIRIEFAGKILSADNELNALTLGAVGSATTLEHIQASWGADDSFEFFGGSVNAKFLISYGANDDDFDFDNGYQGSIQYAVGVRLPTIGPYSANPNGIECNNDTDFPVVNTRKTHPVLSNFTLLGHSATSGPAGGAGVVFRQTTEFTMVNSVIGGWGLGANTTAATSGVSSNNYIQAFTTVKSGTVAFNVNTSNVGTPANNFLKLANPFNLTTVCTANATPDFRFRLTPPPASPANGPSLNPSPSVTHPGGVFPAASSMDDNAYIGAFVNAAGTRWDVPVWVSYAPQTNPY